MANILLRTLAWFIVSLFVMLIVWKIIPDDTMSVLVLTALILFSMAMGTITYFLSTILDEIEGVKGE